MKLIKKLSLAFLFGILCLYVQGQTQVPENSESPIYFNDEEVGIGTSTPSSKLEVYGGDLLINNNNTGNNSYIKFLKGGAQSYIGQTSNGGVLVLKDLSDIANAKINSNGDSYLQGGNVGIGTANPYSKLHIVGGNLDIGNQDAEYAIRFRRATDGSPVGQIRLYESLEMRYTHQGFGGFHSFYTYYENELAERLRISTSGNIGIGTPSPSAKLDVAGNIKAQEIEVTLASMNDLNLNGTLAANNITVKANGNTADFVFEETYNLRDLSELEAFIKENKHLPEIPSAEAMEAQGVNLAEMNKLLLQKVEELTLYTIELEKSRNKENGERKDLEARLERIEKLLLEGE